MTSATVVNEDGTVGVSGFGSGSGSGSGGFTSDGGQHHHQGPFSHSTAGWNDFDQASAEEVFRSAMQDKTIVSETIELYVSDLQDQIEEVGTAMDNGDWSTVRDIAYENKGLIVGIVVPVVALLRWPWLAMVALRGLVAAPAVLWGIMVRSGFSLNPVLVWKIVVRVMHSERERLLRKKASQKATNATTKRSRRNRQQRRSK
jgi:hypothetical protein